MIKNVYWSSCKEAVILFPILMDLYFPRQIFKNTQISNFTKIRPVGAELFHADGQTDGRMDRRTDRHDKTSSRFSQFRECAKI